MSDYALSSVIDFKFATILDAVPTTLAGTPVVSVYKDNSTTQSTAGVSLTVDFDGITGCNQVRVDTSADGTFYSAGSIFSLVVTTGTVGGNSLVGFVIDQFTINKVSALRPTTAGQTIVTGNLDATVSSRLATSGYTAPDNTDIAAIKVKTDFLPSTTAGAAGGLFIAGTNASLTITGNVTVGGGLSIATTVAIGSTLTVVGTTTFGGAINITGNLHCVSNFNIDGAMNIGGVSNISQTGDNFVRIGATGSGLTSLAPSATALSTAVWTPTIAGRIDVTLSTLATAANLATANASLVKIQAANYDSATLSGSTLTLSNAATMVVSSTGRVTT